MLFLKYVMCYWFATTLALDEMSYWSTSIYDNPVSQANPEQQGGRVKVHPHL